MSEQNAPAPCAEFREEIPLLAVGALDRERAELLKKHLTDCAGCEASYQKHCKVLQTVKQESDPERPLDTERVLARLRERIGGAPGGEGDESAAGKERPLALIAAIALISAGLIALLIFARPTTTPQPIEPSTPDAAIVYTARSPGGREIKSGESFKTRTTSARFRIGDVEVRLKSNSELRLKKDGFELISGTAAVSVPTGAKFDISVPAAAASVTAEAKTRFVISLDADGKAELSVAESAVILKHGDSHTVVELGKRVRFSKAGLAGPPENVDPRAAFAWLTGELYEGLSLELIVLRPARVVLSLRNASDGPISVTGYHPLGVSYQLEIRRPGSTSPEFVKLAPSSLRLQRAPGIIENVRETMGQLVIEPDQSFELEMDLGPLFKQPGTYRVAAEYLGFGPSGGMAAKLGLLLRSNEVKVIISSGPSGKGTSK